MPQRPGRTIRALPTVAGVGGLALGALVALAPQADAVPTCSSGAGKVPVALGSPKADVNGVKDAGSVEIRTNCDGSAATQTLTLPDPKAGDNFGFAVVDVNLNFDGTPGLLVGIPQYDVGTAKDAGAVASYRYESGKFVLDRIITQDSEGVPGDVQAGAKFGAALKTFNDLGVYDEVAVRIGVPRLDVGSATDAGGVVDLVYYLPENGGAEPVSKDTRLYTLDTPGVPWVAHSGDRFGAAIGGYDGVSSVGAPGRTVTGHAEAGAVLTGLAVGGPSSTFTPTWVTQLSKCVTGVPETGDQFGAALSGRWIGVPGEDLDGVADAGMVSGGCTSFTEKSKGFQGAMHAGDHFGAALYESIDYVDGGTYAPSFLAIGAPGADTSKGRNSGSISYVGESVPNPESGTVKIYGPGVTPGSRGVPGAALGTGLGSYGFGSLLAAAPGGRGVVYAFEQARDGKLVVDHVYSGPGTEDGVYGAAPQTSL